MAKNENRREPAVTDPLWRERKDKRICVACCKPVRLDDFKTILETHHYWTSGLCAECQDALIWFAPWKKRIFPLVDAMPCTTIDDSGAKPKESSYCGGYTHSYSATFGHSNILLYWATYGWCGEQPRGPYTGQPLSIDIGNGISLDLVWIPPGTFMMGSPENEPGRHKVELPQHIVTLTKGFWMGKYEVTQEQWQTFMGINPSEFKGAKLPVESVSWDDCQEFLQRLNERLQATDSRRHTFRLPTEAEWEYACRAGTTGPYAGDLDAMAWYGKNSNEMTQPVGQKKPNAWGLYDMHGNVSEWCNDYFGDYPSEDAVTVDPAASEDGGRIYRGGSWFCDGLACRSAYRWGMIPSRWNRKTGLRVVMDA